MTSLIASIPPEKKYLRAIVLVLIFALLLVHLFSLSIYPVPWFDETLLASVSKDFMERRHFFPSVAPIAHQSFECLAYGPVFFVVQAAFFKMLGFGSFAARLVGFVFGLTMCWWILKIFLLNRKEAGWLGTLLLAGLLFDYTVFETFHLGRMETLALTFSMCYTFFILKNDTTQDKSKALLNGLLYGVLASLAVLTTPRSGILLIAPGLILLYRWIGKRKTASFIELLTLSVVFSLLTACWINYAFGGYKPMMDYYKIVSNTNDFTKGFSFRNSIYVYHYPVIITCLSVAMITFIRRGKLFFDPINCICLFSLVMFYSVITMFRPYSVYVIVYFYLLGFNSLYQLSQENSGKRSFIFSELIVYLLLLAMLFVTEMKTYYILDSAKERNSAAVNSFVSQYIPAGSKVIGEDTYYFSVLKAGSDLQYINVYDADENREKYQREKYNYDYIFITDQLLRNRPDLFNTYGRKSKLEWVARFNAPLSRVTAYVNARFPELVSFNSYNGVLYKRLKESQEGNNVK